MIQRINSFRLFGSIYKPKISQSVAKYAAVSKSFEQKDQEKWSEIYRLPLIRLASAFNRLKVYQAIVTAVGTPAMIALEQSGQVDPNFGFVFGTLGVTGVLTLSLCSLPIQKLIGFIYMNDTSDKIKLGYVDFWGRRRDQIIPIENISAPWETPEPKINIKFINELNLFQKVTNREDESQSYKLLNHFGVYSDPGRFIKVFGDVND